MSWRAPEKKDLEAVINDKEVEAYKRGTEKVETDVAAELMKQAAGVLRGYMRRGGVTMSPNVAEIPEELMGPTMDYAAYSLCKRFNIQISKERTDAFNKALDLFKAVAKREVVPENYTNETTATGGRVLPKVSDPAESAILG